MEKQDLSKYLIKDSEYYNSNSAYVGMLKRNNILTVDQILDDSFLNLRCKCQTSRELSALIAMLRYRYLDAPLCTDILLDKEIDLEFIKLFPGWSGNCVPLLDEEERKKKVQMQREYFAQYGEQLAPSADMLIPLSGLLGCSHRMSTAIMEQFTRFVRHLGPSSYKLPENPKLIDFFQWILTKDEFEKVYPYINTYIEVYEKNQNLENNDSETMEFLRLQLSFLEEERTRLDTQIAFLTEQIGNKNKGGRKK